MPHLLIEKVTKSYGVESQTINAVHDVSLSLEKGDFLSIVGHSGSGKTTLLSLIGGITNPSAGHIYFEGKDLSSLDSDSLSEYRSGKVGFMFQFASLLPMLTVKENLLLPTVFACNTDSRSVFPDKATALIGMVGLSDKIDAYPAQLSGGQQRRVAIARAFMNDPALVLADEPTGDLDEETERDMMDFFKRMNRERDVTFVMVTHNTDLAREAKRRIRMHRGTIVPDSQ